MRQKLSITTLSQYTFFFFSAALLGYLWEVSIFFIQEDTFVNRGFLYGPWLPVYGTGAVILYILLHQHQNHPLRVFFFSMLIGTWTELISGILLDYFWGLRYWDYSGYLWNFYGYVCILSALGFGFAGVLWICVLSRFLLHLWNKIPASVQRIILTLLVLVFIADCSAALIFPNRGKSVTF
ncbi:MAG: putative ABC transporter permease [Roseburia sp.]